jgi:hypothetical protein
MNDEIISVVYLILILVLILPGFLYANKNRKTFFNNLFIWAIIIGIIVILIKFFTNKLHITIFWTTSTFRCNPSNIL